MEPKPITFTHRGRSIVVTKNDGHPEQYLWIEIDGARFHLGVLTPRLRTRPQVERFARAWLAERDARESKQR